MDFVIASAILATLIITDWLTDWLIDWLTDWKEARQIFKVFSDRLKETDERV